MKHCKGCDTLKPTSKFHKRRGRPSGLQSRCIECKKSTRVYKPECSIKLKTRKVMSRYGLTLDEYDSLFETPCDICGADTEVCDHDHSTGKVRGGLCRLCNSGLGMFRDNKAFMQKAIEYLGDNNEAD